ncbi:hypothetical protein [Marinicrinis lubricantis]|uniref:Intracellular proteinase inhibitor BsuPI domain-containing protein n=1 Tax=Marinicrinis lubricantis TaxID=2086470 RepID=A0ABW1IRQ6_9BACL
MYIIILTVSLILASCSNSSGNSSGVAAEKITDSHGVDTNQNPFTIRIDVLSEIKVNQPFNVVGTLKNNTNAPIRISYGANLFTYQIMDQEGKPIEQDAEILLAVNDIGFETELEPGTAFRYNGEDHRSKAYYEFTMSEPGTYRVRATATF